MASNPTLFADRAEAEAEALARMLAMRAAQAIVAATPVRPLGAARRVVVLDGNGNVLLETDLA